MYVLIQKLTVFSVHMERIWLLLSGIMAGKQLLPLPWDRQVATRGKRALLRHAFHKQAQNKREASMNIQRRKRSPEAQVDFLFIGICWQVGESVLGDGVGGHGTACAAPVTFPWNVHLGACTEGLAGGWPHSNQELPLPNPTAGAFLDISAVGNTWTLHLNLFCFIWRSFEK